MNRAALEHILRAAAAIADERDFVVIGSQAVLGQFPHAPDALLVSIEADIYPRRAPAKSDLIDGAIGELLRERMVDPALLEERVTMLSDPGGVRDVARSRLSQVLRRTS